jgi:hypothetical protein
MSILTGRELEFLSSLDASWSRLYRTELARLLQKDDDRCDARRAALSIVRTPVVPSWHSHGNSANATKS